MKRTILFTIIIIFALLLGAGVVWYIYKKPIATIEYASPSGGEFSRPVEDIEKNNIFNIEKIINEVPFREIKTTKREYEVLGWNKYENREIGFEMYYPGDWKVSEGSKGRGDTSDDPSYLGIWFAPKTLFVDFTFGLYIYKEPLKERLLKIAERGLLPVERLRINNADAVIHGRYNEEEKRAYGNVIFGSDNWTISFVSEPNNPSVYERMLKSFRLLSEK